jgi:hypothetical protein
MPPHAAGHLEVVERVSDLCARPACGAGQHEFALARALVERERCHDRRAQVALEVGAQDEVGVALHDPIRGAEEFRAERFVVDVDPPSAADLARAILRPLDHRRARAQ